MRLTTLTIICALASGLSGCGGSGEAGETGAAADAARPNQAGGAEAVQEAAGEGGLAKLRCPAKTDKSLAGPDIIGVKLGMTRDEAMNVVRCHDENAHLELEDRWFDQLNTYAVKLDTQAFTAQSGDTSECSYRTFDDMQRCGMGNRVWDHVSETIKVASPGLPGRETVVGVWRTQNFKPGEMPAVESLLAALREKYGAPQLERQDPSRSQQRVDVIWVTDTAGAALGEANPLFNQCGFSISARPDGSQTWTDGCGLSIRASIRRSNENPDVAMELSVGMMHQSNLYAYGDALQLELEDIEQKRLQQELEQAKDSSGVKL